MSINNLFMGTPDMPSESPNKPLNMTALYTSLYKEYCQSKISSPQEKVDFINKITNATTLPDSIKNDIRSFAGKNDKYDGLNCDTLSIHALKRELHKECIKIHRQRQRVRDKFLIHFDITPQQYDKHISKEIEKLPETELGSLQDLEKQQDFLSKIYKQLPQNQPLQRDISKIFDGLDQKFQNKYHTLSDARKEKFAVFLGEREHFHPYSDTFLASSSLKDTLQAWIKELLFEWGDIFTSDQKRDFIQTYIPSISLRDAKRFKFLDSSSIEQYKVSVLKESLGDGYYQQLTPDEQKNILSLIDEKEIFVSTSAKNFDVSTLPKLPSAFKDLSSKIAKDLDAKYKKIKDGPQDLKTFQNALQEAGVQGHENFQVGSFIELKFKNKLGQPDSEFTRYLKIAKAEVNKENTGAKEQKDIELIFQGQNGFAQSMKTYKHDYASFLRLVHNGHVQHKVAECSIFSAETFKQKKDSGEIQCLLTNDNLKEELQNIGTVKGVEHFKQGNIIKTISKGDDGQEVCAYCKIESDDASHLFLKNIDGNIDEIDLSYADFLAKIRDKSQVEFQDIDTFHSDMLDGKIPKNDSGYLFESHELTSLKNFLRSEYPADDDTYYSKLKLCNDFTYQSLKKQIDKIDPEGSEFELKLGTTFSTPEGETYRITEIDMEAYPGIIRFQHSFGDVEEEKLDFGTFFKTFKGEGCKRDSNVQTFEAICDKEEGIWCDFTLANKKIKSTRRGKENDNFDYLVSSSNKNFIDGSNLLKIDSIDGSYAKVHLGSFDESDDTTVSYNTEKKSYTIHIGMLHKWIKKSSLEPKSSQENSTEETIDVKHVERRGKLLGSYPHWFSFSDIIGGGKVFFDNIKQLFNKGSELQAAKIADIFSRFIPGTPSDSMKMILEQAEKKNMDEYLEKLEGAGASHAIPMVEGWLKDLHANQFQVEAALMFMAKKYGHLYTKNALYQHKGSFLWYRALGGKVGDNLFRDMKQDAEDNDRQFSETDLIIELVTQQSTGKLKPPRRSKFNKELKAVLMGGKNDEYEAGTNDADSKSDLRGSLEVALGELQTGGYINAMGALTSIINKGDGGNLVPLNKVPFVMLFSGVAYTFDPNMCVRFFQKIIGEGNPLPIVTFLSKISKIDTFNETVLELSKDLAAEIGGDYKGMPRAAQQIFDSQKNPHKKESEKIKDAIDFFDTYGEALTRSLNFLNTRKDDPLSAFDKRIFYKKEEVPIYKQYWKMFDGFVSSADFVTNKEATIMNAFHSDGTVGGISGMNMYKIAKEHLGAPPGGGMFKMEQSGPMFWEEITAQFSQNITSDRLKTEEKKIILKNDLRGVMAAIIETRDAKVSSGSIYDTNTFQEAFNQWGVKKEDFDTLSFNDILNPDHSEANKVLNECVEHMLGPFVVEDTVHNIRDNTSNVL